MTTVGPSPRTVTRSDATLVSTVMMRGVSPPGPAIASSKRQAPLGCRV